MPPPPLHKYKKNPEFNGLEVHVWEYLNQIGRTIPQIQEGGKGTSQGDQANRELQHAPIWHNKAMLDDYVAGSLGRRIDDYGTDKGRNPLYKAVANEVANLRKSGILIDWRRVKGGSTGMGVWRLDKTRLARFARDRFAAEMRNRDYHASGEQSTVYVRYKQRAFRAELLREYGRCVFCGFRLTEYMTGAHIVPYSVMRVEEAANAMNPVNGLLLCKLCDIAFERGSITVGEDLGIEVSDRLRDQTVRAVRSWVGLIQPEIRVDENARYRPDARYIRWKNRLVREGEGAAGGLPLS